MNWADTSESSQLPGASRYPHLFSPLRLGRLKLPNRFVVPALTTNFAEADGAVGARLVEYLRARARGGYGLIVTENLGVHPSGRVMPRMAMASDERFIPGLRRIVDAVKAEGGLVFAQLSHAGRQTKSRITGMPLVAPSAIPCPLNREMPEALSEAGVRDMEIAFINAAQRVAQAGFDGVEIHGAHGYLVGGFLSSYSNQRADEYGGSLENRMRFLLNIVKGVKHALGEDFPITVRISAREFVPDGLDLAEAAVVAQRLRDAGVHALSVSVGVYESFNRLSMITGEPEGQWLDLAGVLRREAAPLPVIGVGRIKRPDVAERALETGQIDLAAFGRASIADPDLPEKVLHGLDREVTWCLGCNICLGRSSRPETICPVNPLVGREHEVRLERAPVSRSILISGGSLAALTAAWFAARRGHDVTVDTRSEPLGGLQAWRAKVPGQEEYAETVDALVRRAAAAGVRFGPARAGPETVIWCESRFLPMDPTWLERHARVCSAYDVLTGKRAFAPATRIAVVGADLAAAEAALLLADAGCRVRLCSPARDIAADAHPGYREANRRRLREREVDVVVNAGPDEQLLSWAEALVVGHPPEADYEDPDHWRDCTTITDADSGHVLADAYITDAYEPGLMTRGIYEAMNLALGLDGGQIERADVPDSARARARARSRCQSGKQ